MNFDTSLMPIDESFWVITGKLRAGEYPGSLIDKEASRKLRWLINQGFSIFIDLTEEGEHGLKPYANLLQEEASKANVDIHYIRMPLTDYSVPSQQAMIEVLNTIDQAFSNDKKIYLHCYGGKGRTGTVIGCFLVRRGMTGEKALEMIKELRKDIPGRDEKSPETEGQKRMVLEWKPGQ